MQITVIGIRLFALCKDISVVFGYIHVVIMVKRVVFVSNPIKHPITSDGQ